MLSREGQRMPTHQYKKVINVRLYFVHISLVNTLLWCMYARFKMRYVKTHKFYPSAAFCVYWDIHVFKSFMMGILCGCTTWSVSAWWKQQREYCPALISEILAGFKGIAVSSCINLKEKLWSEGACEIFRVAMSEFEDPSLRPCGHCGSGPALGSSSGQPSLSCELLLGTCSAHAQDLIRTCIFLTTSRSWQSSCCALGALEITTVSPCQCGCCIWLHSLGLTEEGKGRARWDFLTATPRFLARCKLIPFLAAVDKVVLREVLTVEIAQSREEK